MHIINTPVSRVQWPTLESVQNDAREAMNAIALIALNMEPGYISQSKLLLALMEAYQAGKEAGRE